MQFRLKNIIKLNLLIESLIDNGVNEGKLTG